MAPPSILSSLSTDKTTFLGPSYNYSQQILTPMQVGLSGEGSFDQLASDVGGMIGYIETLVSGISNNQKIPNKPLGNKFFVRTLARCTDGTGDKQDRYIYINNVPTGNIPLVSAAAGVDFEAFRGLVPGVLTNLEVLDPADMVNALVVGANPLCTNVSFPVVDNSGVMTTESHYVLNEEVIHMDPCAIKTETTEKPTWAVDACKASEFCFAADECSVDGFQNMFSNKKRTHSTDFEQNKDTIKDIYFIILGLMGLYFLLKLLHKKC